MAKLTPDDYPDLLVAVDAGISQRELARRYDCAPSLVARHVARAQRARDLSERPQEPDLGLSAEPHNGSMREILEARLRDPSTSARDLASLANAIAKLDSEDAEATCVFHVTGPDHPPNPQLDQSATAWLCAPRTAQRPHLFPAVWAPRVLPRACSARAVPALGARTPPSRRRPGCRQACDLGVR